MHERKHNLPPLTHKTKREHPNLDAPLEVFLFQFERALQRHNAVEYQMIFFGIYNVVTITHELITLTFLCTGDRFFNDHIFLHFQRVGVHDHFTVRIVRVVQHHVVVQSRSCLHVVGSAYPVQRTFDFSAFKTTAASCFRVICAVYFYYICLLYTSDAADEL